MNQTKGPNHLNSNQTPLILTEQAQDIERWDDAFEFGSNQSFDQIFEQLHRHLPRSPLSDSSDQSDYFQPRSSLPRSAHHLQEPLSDRNKTKPIACRRASCSSYTHALPTPPTTTTATTLMSSKPTHGILSDSARRFGGSEVSIKRLVSSIESHVKPHSCSDAVVIYLHSTSIANSNNYHNINNNNINTKGITSRARSDALPPRLPSPASTTTRDRGEKLDTERSSSISSNTSSPRAVTASTAPSIIATSTASMLNKDKGKESDEDECPTPSTKAMTTITLDMMLSSNLPAYTGIITRINPIKRVEDWVDDLDDLEVPEQDLDFSQVCSNLAKSSSAPETLESVDSWETDSENSAARSDDNFIQELQPSALSPLPGPHASATARSPLLTVGFFQRDDDLNTPRAISPQTNKLPESETIETMDDDFDLPSELGSLRLNLEALRNQKLQEASPNGSLLREQSSLLRWQDSDADSDFGIAMDNRSLSSSGSSSKDSMGDDEDLLDGLIFPEAMEDLKLVTNRPYRPETEPSIFGKESRFQDDQEDFWDGLDISGEDLINRKGRNKNLVIRIVPSGRERSGSRVQRQVVPLKDFVALPSRIPRLCRAPGDTFKPVTPAPCLSRKHSTQFELPLRNLKSKSSLPRLKRGSISRRESTRSSLMLSPADAAVPSSDSGSAYSSPHVSRAPTPTASYYQGSKRNSLLFNKDKDDFPSFKSSSLVLRSVSFTEPKVTEPKDNVLSEKPAELKEQTLPPQSPITSKPPSPSPSPASGKSFPSFRTLVKKFARPGFTARGLIPVFESFASPKLTPNVAVVVPPVEPHLLPANLECESRSSTRRPSISRSSSSTDWDSILASTETTKESRPSSRAGLFSLGDISEVSTTDVGMSVAPVAASDRFSRRLFVIRSPKHSMFGDGSELDRLDNLPLYGSLETSEDERLRSTQLKAQIRKQSTDRVADWLRKPSIANLKELNKPEVKPVEPEPTSSKARRTRSIRKSIFDIFGQSSSSELAKQKEREEKEQKEKEQKEKEQKEKEQREKEQREKEKEKKKKKTSNGPTLIRDLSQSKVRQVSGMVFNPNAKMWTGNDDILDDFEDEVYTSPSPSEYPGSPPFQSFFPSSPTSRPALISNMNQLKQRAQVAGKMIFDPARMCWVVNPEYIAKRRQRRKQNNNHHRERSLDEAWGDEPDVFAGLSDDEKSQGEDWGQEDGEGTTGSNSIGASKGARLQSRPSFQRISSQGHLANASTTADDDESSKAWAETTATAIATAGNTVCNEGTESRPVSTVVHTIISKSSRKSLNGLHNGCPGGLGGGGYSSQGEFEVGVEFDITESLLEQCIAAEAQHRRDAGKFFALPCTRVASNEAPLMLSTLAQVPAPVSAPSPTPRRLSRMASSKMLTLGRKSSKSKSQAKENEMEQSEVSQKNKEKEKGKGKAIDSGKVDTKDVVTSPAATTTSSESEKKKLKDLSLPSKTFLSWPPRNKAKSRSIVAQLMNGDIDGVGNANSSDVPFDRSPIEIPSKPKKRLSMLALRPKKSQSNINSRNSDESIGNKGSSSGTNSRNSISSDINVNVNVNVNSSLNTNVDTANSASKTKSKSKTFGRASLFPFTSTSSHSSTPSSTAPAAATLAARGRGGGPHDVFFHRLPTKHESMRGSLSGSGTLSFSATLAAARRGGPLSYDRRRRIGNHTFDPLNNGIKNHHHDGDNGGIDSEKTLNGAHKDRAIGGMEGDFDDLMDRGYRSMTGVRGRPPMRPRAELVSEFERHAGERYR
ncbi:hypothetical protein BGX21_008452 [Mortierella sp. AD011]|nr:hypothetical protein BGX20_001850 [Mortierella sp. AD010]KAF9403886.1 hypothetical protein BGX21_008452 [Mortierella sp. AD011]